MNTIHLVSAYVEYEGSWPIKAFDTKEGAAAFASQCREHMALRPKFDMDATKDEIALWSKLDNAWRDAHPAGSDVGSPDDFVVAEYPFEVATKETE